MIRSSDVWVRRGVFVKPVSNDPAACLSDSTGLTGAHKKAYEQVAKGCHVTPCWAWAG